MPSLKNVYEIMVEIICNEQVISCFDLKEFNIVQRNGMYTLYDTNGTFLEVPAGLRWDDYGDDIEAVLETDVNEGCKVRISYNR